MYDEAHKEKPTKMSSDSDPLRTGVIDRLAPQVSNITLMNQLLERFWELQETWDSNHEVGFDKRGLLVLRENQVLAENQPEQKRWRLEKGLGKKDPHLIIHVDTNDTTPSGPAEISTASGLTAQKSSTTTGTTGGAESTTLTGSAATPADSTIDGSKLRRSQRTVPRSNPVVTNSDGGTKRARAKSKKRARSIVEEQSPKKKARIVSRSYTQAHIDHSTKKVVLSEFKNKLAIVFPDTNSESLTRYLYTAMEEILEDPRQPGSWGEETKNIMRGSSSACASRTQEI